MTCVSWAHCNMTLFLRHVAVQTRDRQKGAVCYGPGSAAHHERARRRAQTAHAALRPGHTTDSLIRTGPKGWDDGQQSPGRLVAAAVTLFTSPRSRRHCDAWITDAPPISSISTTPLRLHRFATKCPPPRACLFAMKPAPCTVRAMG